jgi:hypothetical protein
VIDVRPEPGTVVAGQTARFVLEIAPRSRIYIESIRAVLTATESVAPREPRSPLKQVTLYQWDREDASIGAIDGGQTRRVEFEQPIPVEAPGSFYEWGNLLEYKCAIEIKMQGALPWTARFPFLVYPV